MLGADLVSRDPLNRLAAELARLPGIGERTGMRLAYYIVRSSCGAALRPGGRRVSETLPKDLAAALLAVSEQVHLCSACRNFCTEKFCHICLDQRRERRLLCIVEDIVDLRAIEAARVYKGLFHVLLGALSPLDGIGPKELGLEEVVARVKEQAIEEVILAMNANVDGDTTALYLARLLKPLGVKITRLACGMPMGGELEYLDAATLGQALKERREF